MHGKTVILFTGAYCLGIIMFSLIRTNIHLVVLELDIPELNIDIDVQVENPSPITYCDSFKSQ